MSNFFFSFLGCSRNRRSIGLSLTLCYLLIYFINLLITSCYFFSSCFCLFSRLCLLNCSGFGRGSLRWLRCSRNCRSICLSLTFCHFLINFINLLIASCYFFSSCFCRFSNLCCFLNCGGFDWGSLRLGWLRCSSNRRSICLCLTFCHFLINFINLLITSCYFFSSCFCLLSHLCFFFNCSGFNWGSLRLKWFRCSRNRRSICLCLTFCHFLINFINLLITSCYFFSSYFCLCSRYLFSARR